MHFAETPEPARSIGGILDGYGHLDGDTVWVIGDFALGKIAETLPLVAELSGHKILVAGNHDRCWAGNGRRAEGWTERYLESGFAKIVQGSAKVKIGDRTVLAYHFPFHVHERWAQQDRMINVGVDVTGFSPIRASEITALIDAGPNWPTRLRADPNLTFVVNHPTERGRRGHASPSQSSSCPIRR